jgi:hypothetical protein
MGVFMPITPPVEQWLKEAGYKYHCFISYPRIKNEDGSDDKSHPISQCARGVREAVLQGLKFSIPNPRVFLDSEEVRSGVDWEQTLREALCKSLVMVAICAGIYYHPDHLWCGLEWAAMDDLGKKRLPENKLLAIIPVMVKIEKPIPPTVERPQWVDISGMIAQKPQFRPSNDFKRIIIRQVVRHIEDVAEAIFRQGIKTDCAHFTFPNKSAFADWQPVSQAPPFYTKPTAD